ncbi:uncharacterized protein LOC131849639 [Achroia grisella]|uniref:uncharacterized protein LOC131849639 n=1 Tax=Achroia grisella TaxID=688607 RepID=UPI0027D29AC0|nr:uncharacterized protein LOC131849639 [Achroia grisella]
MAQSDPDGGGCVNKAFDGLDDGFQTIDLRNRREDNPNGHKIFQRDAEPEGESAGGVYQDEDDSLRCGWGSLRPKWLQRFRTAKWALFWLCWAGAIQGLKCTLLDGTQVFGQHGRRIKLINYVPHEMSKDGNKYTH